MSIDFMEQKNSEKSLNKVLGLCILNILLIIQQSRLINSPTIFSKQVNIAITIVFVLITILLFTFYKLYQKNKNLSKKILSASISTELLYYITNIFIVIFSNTDTTFKILSIFIAIVMTFYLVWILFSVLHNL